MIQWNDSTRPFHFAVQQLSSLSDVAKAVTPFRSCTIVPRPERRIHATIFEAERLQWLGSLWTKFRSESAGRNKPIRNQSGRAPDVCVRAGTASARACFGRGSAWLRPDRGRLRYRRWVVEACEALRLRLADAGTAGREQCQHLLQLVQSG